MCSIILPKLLTLLHNWGILHVIYASYINRNRGRYIMRKRVRSYVCLVLFLVMCLNFSAVATNDNDSTEVKATANYSYETFIYTSGVTIGVDNYSCLISYETLEILPMVLTKEGNSLVYHDGNTLKSGDSVQIKDIVFEYTE